MTTSTEEHRHLPAYPERRTSPVEHVRRTKIRSSASNGWPTRTATASEGIMGSVTADIDVLVGQSSGLVECRINPGMAVPAAPIWFTRLGTGGP